MTDRVAVEFINYRYDVNNEFQNWCNISIRIIENASIEFSVQRSKKCSRKYTSNFHISFVDLITVLAQHNVSFSYSLKKD